MFYVRVCSKFLLWPIFPSHIFLLVRETSSKSSIELLKLFQRELEKRKCRNLWLRVVVKGLEARNSVDRICVLALTTRRIIEAELS